MKDMSRGQIIYREKGNGEEMKEFTEKLISRLEEESYNMEICEEQFDMNRPYFKDVPYKMLKLEDVKTIISQFAEEYLPDTNVGNKDGWIPVEERLPEDKQQVLITNWDHSVFLARYDENGKRFVDIRNSFTLPLIFAWMPLPEPYREKGE